MDSRGNGEKDEEDKKYKQLFHTVWLKYYQQDGSGGYEFKKETEKKMKHDSMSAFCWDKPAEKGAEKD